jgi:hypothetical protein
VAVLASTAAVLALEVPLAAGLVELDELEQPAARRMEPIAATVATIVLDARKINPPMLSPGVRGQACASWLDTWNLG